MLLLAFHIVAVGTLIFVVAIVAYRAGLTEGRRRERILSQEAGHEGQP